MERVIKNFSDLPENIREWLASTRLTYIVIDMNRRLGIREEREIIIPQLINDLVFGEVEPRRFINELSSRLNLSPSSAKIITKEIEEKILHPIEPGLKELGIDVGLLHFPEEPEKLRTGEIEKIKPEITPIPTLPEKKPKEMPIGGPLIIHAEREEVKPPMVPPRPTFSIRIPLNQKKYTPPAPIKARIETGEDRKEEGKSVLPPLGPLSSLPKTEPGAKPILNIPKTGQADPFVKKVVNYSEWLTPLE